MNVHDREHKANGLTAGMKEKPRNIGVTTRDIKTQNVWGKWKWPIPSCGSGNCYILYIYCTCLRKWQKNPVLAKNNEFTSTGVTLWGLHKPGRTHNRTNENRMKEILLCYCLWVDLTHHLTKFGKYDCKFYIQSWYIPLARNSSKVCTTVNW